MPCRRYQYSEQLLKASREQSAMRWAVEAAFSRACLDRWMQCPVRRAILHYAESMILTSLLNTLWHQPFAQPKDWDEVGAKVQARYAQPLKATKGGDQPVCPTNLFEYFVEKLVR